MSGKTVSELIFLRCCLELATQCPLYTSCLWGLQGRRWKRWKKWKRWTHPMLALLSLRFMFFRKRKKWRSTSVATLTLWVLVFVWSFCFFLFGRSSSPFPFYRHTLRWVPCANLPLVFVGTHGLLIPLTKWICFHFRSSVVSAALLSAIDESNIAYTDMIKYFQTLRCNTLLFW